MKKTIRTILYSFAILLLLGVALSIYANYAIHHKITQFLSNRLPSHVQVSYQDIDIRSVSGSVEMKQPRVFITNPSDTIIHTNLKAEKVLIKDVGYIDLIFNKEINIATVEFITPEFTQYQHKINPTTDTIKAVSSSAPTKPVKIDVVTIQNGSMRILENNQKDTSFRASFINITLNDILFNKKTQQKYLPITFESYALSGSDVLLGLSEYESLSVQQINIDSQSAILTTVDLSTKYDKEQLAVLLPKERDHFNTTIDEITIDDFDIQVTDTVPRISGSRMTFIKPNLTIYRDKLLPDDTSVKPMYSTMIREMNLQLSIDKTFIEQGDVVYIEKIKDKNEGGTINLSNLNGTIDYFGNAYRDNQKTAIDITGTFMKSTPMKITWEFDSSDGSDGFEFKGHLGYLDSQDLNVFLQPNLNVKLDGSIKDTYFSIYGNTNSSAIDMKMKYDNLEVTVMEKNGIKINEFLSGLVNLIIKNDSLEDVSAFRETTTTVERDVTKSFFNYVWLNIRAGLLKIISG